jgi:DNA polymerase-3 subunit delta
MSTTPVLDFLAAKERPRPAGVCVLFGDEPFLRRLALAAVRQIVVGDGTDVPVTRHDCQERQPEWRDVADELATVSLFGGGSPRLVVLEGADSFVTAQRARLEDYVAQPKRSGVLLLVVDEWPSNTRLYKAVDQSGLQIDCRPPQRQVG